MNIVNLVFKTFLSVATALFGYREIQFEQNNVYVNLLS